MNSEKPYISFVVTSRNDNHGGDLLRRMQMFVDCLIEQCNRYKLDAELIIVEWNPPADRPRFAQALTWPEHNRFCSVRIIEVLSSVHRAMKHSNSLPLFQMIGKNVGIRRARGEYVLATNIDIIFSNELIQYLSAKPLTPDCMYRNNRYDIDANLPQGKGVDTIIRHGRENHIRVALREGTFELYPDGKRKPNTSNRRQTGEVFAVMFGNGWSPSVLDLFKYEVFNWRLNKSKYILKEERDQYYIRKKKEISVSALAEFERKLGDQLTRRKRLAMHWTPEERIKLKDGVFEILDADNQSVCRFVLGDIAQKCKKTSNVLAVVLAVLRNAFFYINPVNLINRGRTHFRWLNNPAELIVRAPALADNDNVFRLWLDVKPGPGIGFAPARLKVFNEKHEEIWRGYVPSERAWISVPVVFNSNAENSFSFAIDSPRFAVINDSRLLNLKVYDIFVSDKDAPCFRDIFDPESGLRLGRGWDQWRAGIRRMTNGAEVILPKRSGTSVRMRIATAGDASVNLTLRDATGNTAGAGESNQNIALEALEDGLNVINVFTDDAGKALKVKRMEIESIPPMPGMHDCTFPAPHIMLDLTWEQCEAGYKIPNSATLAVLAHPAYDLNCKIRVIFGNVPVSGKIIISDRQGNTLAENPDVKAGTKPEVEFRTATNKTRVFSLDFITESDEVFELVVETIENIISGDDIMLSPEFAKIFRPIREKEIEQKKYTDWESIAPDLLHTNACGDFTLMSRDNWFRLHGYPEWEIFSMHLDSATCFAAHYAGIRETILEDPLCIYHMEHSIGSGWTPKGEKKMYRRLKKKKIRWLDYHDLMQIAAMMHYWRIPAIYSADTWGLAKHQLNETTT